MKHVFIKPEYCGIAFKNGKLYSFQKRYVLVMTSWPDPRAWYKRHSHDWRATRKMPDQWFSGALEDFAGGFKTSKSIPLEEDEFPEGSLPPVEKNNYEEQNEKARLRRAKIYPHYFNLIPPEIRQELLKYHSRKWHVFNLLARCPGSLDLCRNNPALLYALASNWVFHQPAVQQPIRAARSLVNKRQIRILEWLGFPATENTRRIFLKLETQTLSIEALLHLRKVLQDPAMTKCLSHLPKVDAAVLRMAVCRRYRTRITPRLLQDISEAGNTGDGKHLPPISIFLDTLRMGHQLGWPGCPGRFVSLDRLRTIHDTLALQYNEAVNKGHSLMPERFPLPPLMGTPSIRPILTPNELLREGIEMAHCVASHAYAVEGGREFVYRVIDPVRATLSIFLRRGRWVPGQLLGAGNAPVDKTLRERLFVDLFASGHSHKKGVD